MVWGGKIWGDGGMFCSAVKRLGAGETFIVQEGKDDMQNRWGQNVSWVGQRRVLPEVLARVIAYSYFTFQSHQAHPSPP